MSFKVFSATKSYCISYETCCGNTKQAVGNTYFLPYFYLFLM